MAFRKIQTLHLSPCTKVYEATEVTDADTGMVESVIKDQGDLAYPDAELFDLKNVLKAGVKLEEVNSKVMKSATVDADQVIAKTSKKQVSNEEVSKE